MSSENGLPASDVDNKKKSTKEGGGEKKDQKAKGDSKCQHEMSPWPDYIQERLNLWDKYMARYKADLAAKPSQSIEITLPDGKIVAGESWRTTPLAIAQGISKGLAEEVVISKVDGDVWDLDRPLERSCRLQLLKFDDDDAKQVFWHSTAHVLGEAMERFYGGLLCYGPPIQDGFYYDMFLDTCGCGDRTTVRSGEDFPRLEEIMKCAIKDKQPFERLELTKAELLDMFKYNEFKVRILNEKVNTPTTTVYRCGPLIDLCRGPHVRHTGKIKSFQVTKVGSAFWEGKQDAESLQRIYGISFPDPKQLKEWQKFQEEAAARDHRKLGRDQELFCFHEMSPGSAFFYPKGAHIYNALMDFIRKEYRKRGFSEVISPNMYNVKLWEQSGHWAHYAKNMFKIDVDKEQFALKPMNCPGHCIMFDSRPRTFKELPLRFADFGVLHRNELAGALSGLTRVRRFQQDDAHIFCRTDQIGQEMVAALQFLRRVYEEVFGFQFQLYLSTRPDDYLGELSDWNHAEEQLKEALEQLKAETGQDYKINPGDGAFYGPKIDIVITDALRRWHQCATIQLDFQLPQRFDLSYSDANSEKQRPVMIHRAVLGSVERMIAILTENYGGKWPFWLSPRQVMVVPVHPALDEYAHKIRNEIYEAGYECDVDDDHSDTFNKKVRLAQLAQYNFILVVGEKEKTNGTVNVRTRDNKVHGELGMPELLERFRKLKDGYVKNSEEF